MPRRRKPIDRKVATRIVPQREDKDCTISALSMWTGETYEDVLRVACGIDDEGAADGLYTTQLIAAADALGIQLKRKRRFNAEVDSGIMYLVHRRDEWTRHVAVLKNGVVIDTNDTVWFDVKKFLRYYQWAPRMLFVETE